MFRRDVVAVARWHDAPMSQVARDVGVSPVLPQPLGPVRSRNPIAN
jgi:hypothetical protein